MQEHTSTPSQRAQEVFFAALNVPAGTERARFLDETCAGDPSLRRWVDEEIDRQLAAGPDGASATSLHTVATETDPTESNPEVETMLAALKPEEAGETIGAYTLRQPLGEGGFGSVWMAEQERPVRRQVALKIIRVGMNSRQVIARFAQERQALALMDHPNIAKVFDAGATPHGRPFFVMELVRGLPITDYCDEGRLSIRQRLELFMQVCYALQHAHQKGIIHRDIKPSNVLVTDQDGHPAPKVIDFGIAKATQQQRLTEMTLVTQPDFLLGTPIYMSPEQAESDGLDIDTRSDIYSLGVLLFALLAGRTPLDPEEARRCNFEELIHLVRDRDLPRPTTVLRQLPPEELAEVAQQRGSEPARMIPTVRGDLEWICMKALEKDRRRRYAAAGDMARDIQRYLLNEPIHARPPSQFYRLRKLASRNRQAVAAMAVILLVLLVGSFISAGEAIHARAAEHDALRSQASEAEQRRRAERESAAARLSEYVANVGLTQQAIASGNLARASELLARERPIDGRPGLRDFAWRYLWQLAQGDAHRSFPDQEQPINALAYSPTGATVALGGLNSVAVCDAATRRQIATLHPGAGSLAFFPDGRTLVTIGEGHLYLWNTADWTEAASWPEGSGPLALSPDGKRLAVVCREGVRVRSTSNWQQTRLLPGAAAPLAFSPDGTVLATDTVTGLTLWPLDGAGAEHVLPDSAGLFSAGGQTFLSVVQALVFSADGATLTAPQNNATERGVFLLRSWDVRTGQELAPMPANPAYPEHTGAITSLILSPDGHTLATTSLDHSVRLWDLAHRAVAGAFHGHHAEVGGGAFAPDGHTLVTGDRSGYVNAWMLPKPQDQDVIPGVRLPLAFSHDGNTIAALTSDGALAFYDNRTRQARQIVPLPGASANPAVAVGNDLATVAWSLEGGGVRLLQVATSETRDLPISGRAVDFLAFTTDGAKLVFSAPEFGLGVQDLRNNEAEPARLPFPARRAVLSPDGRLLAPVSTPRRGHRVGGLLAQGSGPGDAALKGVDVPDQARPHPNDDLLTLWNLPVGSVQATLDVETRHVLDAAFSPDGRLFAAALSDNTVHLWEADTGQPLGICSGHRQVVYAVAFSADGRTLASASEDGTLRFWNVATRQELLSITHLGERMTTVEFSPDGGTLAVGDSSSAHGGQVRLFHAPPFRDTDWELELENLR